MLYFNDLYCIKQLKIIITLITTIIVRNKTPDINTQINVLLNM